MIRKLEINTERIDRIYKDDEEGKKDILTLLEPIDVTENLVGTQLNCNIFLNMYKGYESYDKQPTVVDYGHALTEKSLEKYILTRYGETNPTEYFIEFGIVPFNNDPETQWKEANFINTRGTNTNKSFYDVYQTVDQRKRMEEKADVKGFFIIFTIFEIDNLETL